MNFYPFDYRDVSACSIGTKNVQHAAGRHHPTIQVIARLGCGQCEVGRIDVVRSDFEGLYPYASRAQIRNKGRCDGCFADAAGHASEHNSGK